MLFRIFPTGEGVQHNLRRSGVQDNAVGNSGSSDRNGPIVTGICLLVRDPKKRIESAVFYFWFGNNNNGRQSNMTTENHANVLAHVRSQHRRFHKATDVLTASTDQKKKLTNSGRWIVSTLNPGRTCSEESPFDSSPTHPERLRSPGRRGHAVCARDGR